MHSQSLALSGLNARPRGAAAMIGALIAIGLPPLLALALGRTPAIVPDRSCPPPAATPPGASADPGVSASWWSEVRSGLARREYEPRPGEHGLQAANRAQNFRTYYRAAGTIAVVPRQAAAEGSWEFSWRTAGYGRAGEMMDIDPERAAPVQPEVNGSRVAYTHGHPERGLTEWYVNRKEGLEQGFTVHGRPRGAGPVRIEGVVAGDLRPELCAEGAIDLVDSHGEPVLRYGELHVWDARDEELPARLALEDDRLAILIDDAGAEYPLTVDPLLSAPSWIAEIDQAEAFFGFSVATAGDVNGDGFSDVLVGSLQYDNGETNEGGAFLYLGSPTGPGTSFVWSTESNQVEGRLGQAVASAGDVNGDGFGDVIIGDFAYDNGESNEGRASVFHGSASGLAATPAWTAESNQATAWFSNAVASAGDVNGDGFGDVIIGAYNYDNGESDEGRAYVYHGSASGLAATPAWTAESNQESAFFGYSCASAGDVNADGFSDVIVGSQFYDNGEQSEGRAFLYLGSASGLQTFAAWTAEPNQSGAWFGYSVGTAGDVNGDGYSDVIVGSIFYSNGESQEGRAFVYHGFSSGLGPAPAWTQESNQMAAGFGNMVATAGDVNGDGYADVIVTASAYDNGQTDEGRAHVFQGSAQGLATTPIWTAETDQESARIHSVATAGDVNGDGFSDVILGSYFYDGGLSNEGRAFLYLGAPTGLTTTLGWIAQDDRSLDQLGFSVATAGDVNGDGYSDLLVGVPGWDNGQNGEGAAFTYLGAPTGPAGQPSWIVESNQDDAAFGSAVATAGDVNGDGYSDVVVGAYLYDNGQVDEGRAFVYHGSPAGLGAAPAWTAESNQAAAAFGVSVAGAGDVNGDGYSDVVVGANLHDNGQADEGRASVYHGSPAGLGVAAAWTGESNQAGAAFGVSVAGAGDVNGDGYSDVVVGANLFDNGQIDEGRAFLHHGSAAGLATVQTWTAESNQTGAEFGAAVGGAGDVNADGFSDVIAGAHLFDNGEVDEGRTFAYLGSATGLAAAAAWTAEPNQAAANFGIAVAAADVNGDGCSDVVVGADLYDTINSNQGRAFAYHGSAAGISAAPDWITPSFLGNSPNSLIGHAVANAGDVNGDGFPDVVVGAPGFSSPETAEGRALLFFGNGEDGLERLPNQARVDNAAPIALLGRSDSETSFRLEVLGRTPLGRGKVRMQCEVKPLGVPFDGQGIVQGPFFDTGAQGGGSSVALSLNPGSLNPGTLYHWRVRIATSSPHFPRSPWLTLPYNAASESDLRTAGATTAIAAEVPSPAGAAMLGTLSPNPFSGSTRLSYTLPAAGHGRLAIYDVAGRQVARLAEGRMESGRQTLQWDGRDGEGRALPAGTYFARLEFAGRVEAQKIVLTR